MSLACSDSTLADHWDTNAGTLIDTKVCLYRCMYTCILCKHTYGYAVVGAVGQQAFDDAFDMRLGQNQGPHIFTNEPQNTGFFFRCMHSTDP